jgi:hypothetical protein
MMNLKNFQQKVKEVISLCIYLIKTPSNMTFNVFKQSSILKLQVYLK